MAVRQYIGARYVPKFVGLWNNTTQYNALEVVDNGAGTSYIARKTVPAGTALTNTEFWFVYGASSGAIIDLQNRMSSAESDIDDLQALETVGRMWYIGDSFLGLTDNWGDYLDNYLQKTDTYVTYEGGIGFVDPGNATGLNLGQKIATLTDVPTDIDCVVVVAGCNDCTTTGAGDYQNFYAQLGNCIIQIKAKAPNARRIIFAFNGTWQDPSLNYYNDAITYVGDVYRMISNRVSEYPRCCVCRSVSSQLQTSILLSDGIHPTAVGSSQIAKCLNNFIVGGAEVTVNFSRQVGPVVFDLCNLEYISAYVMTGGTLAFTGTIAANAYTVLTDTLSNMPYFPRWNGQLHLPFERCNFTTTGSSTYLLNSHILVNKEGKLAIYNPGTAITNVTGLSFGCGGEEITVPMFRQMH